MNFLQIAQKVAAESGTISGTQPVTCQAQGGRLLKIVNWTADAWTDIQNREASWRWMRQPFPSTTVPAAGVVLAGSSYYTASAWNILDFAEWINEPHVASIYSTALGVADETELYFIEWMDYWRRYTRGVQTSDRPQFYSISPQDQLCLAPMPDQGYQVRGMYRQTAQILSKDTDIPACPSRFHDVITWAAVLRLCQHDEAEAVALASAQFKFNEFLGGLERDQLPAPEAYVAPLA